MSKGNSALDINAMGNSNAASSADTTAPGEARLASASLLSDSNPMGASSPLGTSIPGNIARAYEAFDSFWREQNQLYRDVATSFGISESAFSILYAIYLAGEKGISQRDICAQMCIGKQTVNSSIHKLAREGAVTLEGSSGSRGLLAHLTPAGREFAERTIVPMIEAELAALSEFNDRELELSISLGQRYTDALRKHFSHIPGARLTSQNNKTEAREDDAAARESLATRESDVAARESLATRESDAAARENLAARENGGLAANGSASYSSKQAVPLNGGSAARSGKDAALKSRAAAQTEKVR